MSQEDGHKKLLTLKEVAQILDVSTKWMYRHIKTGTLPIDRNRVGKEYRFNPAAVDKYLHQNSVAAGEDYEAKRFLARRQKRKEVAQQ
jgi:excisionase family DNA binding protein